jgi:hypothetical protein
MPSKTDSESALRYGRALHNIQDAMSGKEWNANTFEQIALAMGEAGFHLYDSDDCDGAGPRWASTSSGRIEIQMSTEEAQSCSHSGSCDDDVRALSEVPHIAAQLAEIDPALLAEELSEYGAWDETELADHDQNLQRLLWSMAGDIVEIANTEEIE